jgi:glycerol-3-phosphate dehydrogenase
MNHSETSARQAWTPKGRAAAVERLPSGTEPWDMLIIGGGITGAGILREAAARGLRAVLVEQRDFAWGTSSRSARMVHGGLRYLTQGNFRLTRESVIERQRLLEEVPGLVEPLKFVYAFRRGEFPGRWIFNILLRIYDHFAGQSDRRNFDAVGAGYLLPGLSEMGLRGAVQYTDAITDDARLVMRVLAEAMDNGALALNDLKATRLIHADGRVVGAEIEDRVSGKAMTVHARCVVNATGAWAERLRGEQVDDKRLRPLRGSHLVVPSWRLPVFQALTFRHPQDQRFTYIYPWAGTTVIGTTDLDHDAGLDEEARIVAQELDYLLAGVHHQFPRAGIGPDDVISTWSGVRPIVARPGADPDKIKPSQASRDHVVWNDDGLITVTGGKLTTFRVIAMDVLDEAAPLLGIDRMGDRGGRFFAEVPDRVDGVRFGPWVQRRLTGWYGAGAQALIARAPEAEREFVPGGEGLLWAELSWAAAFEAVQHLDDLLLRRTRLGLLMPRGGLDHAERIGEICRRELGWDDERWEGELARYRTLWARSYSLPPGIGGDRR